jgi:dUTP pyrophosphatase
MDVRLRRISEHARLPSQRDGDVGFDLAASEDVTLKPGAVTMVPTGWELAAEPVMGGSCLHGALRVMLKVEGRSGLASRGIFPVGGVIDPSYRGEIRVMLYNSTQGVYKVRCGERIAQLVLHPVLANWADFGKKVCFKEVDHVEATDRGRGGFGSTGA